MADRLKALRRIESVQKQMVRLAEVRLVRAERVCRELSDDKTRLETYVATEDPLGAPLAKAALKSLQALDRRRQAAERHREAGEAALAATKRREKVIESIAQKASVTARRAEEDRALVDVTEAWLAKNGTSLR